MNSAAGITYRDLKTIWWRWCDRHIWCIRMTFPGMIFALCWHRARFGEFLWSLRRIVTTLHWGITSIVYDTLSKEYRFFLIQINILNPSISWVSPFVMMFDTCPINAIGQTLSEHQFLVVVLLTVHDIAVSCFFPKDFNLRAKFHYYLATLARKCRVLIVSAYWIEG